MGSKTALYLIDVLWHFLSDTVWPNSGTSQGPLIPDVPPDQPPSPCLDKAQMSFPPLFPWKGNMGEIGWEKKRQGMFQLIPHPGSWGNMTTRRFSATQRQPKGWSTSILWMFPRLYCEGCSSVKKTTCEKLLFVLQRPQPMMAISQISAVLRSEKSLWWESAQNLWSGCLKAGYSQGEAC